MKTVTVCESNGFAPSSKIILAVPFRGSALKKLKIELKTNGQLIDATMGHPCRSMIFLADPTGRVVATSITMKTLRKRFSQHRPDETEINEEEEL